jgi:hypothetical protein
MPYSDSRVSTPLKKSSLCGSAISASESEGLRGLLSLTQRPQRRRDSDALFGFSSLHALEEELSLRLRDLCVRVRRPCHTKWNAKRKQHVHRQQQHPLESRRLAVLGDGVDHERYGRHRDRLERACDRRSIGCAVNGPR